MQQEGVYTPTAQEGAPWRGDGPGPLSVAICWPGRGRGPHSGVRQRRDGMGPSRRGVSGDPPSSPSPRREGKRPRTGPIGRTDYPGTGSHATRGGKMPPTATYPPPPPPITALALLRPAVASLRPAVILFCLWYGDRENEAEDEGAGTQARPPHTPGTGDGTMASPCCDDGTARPPRCSPPRTNTGGGPAPPVPLPP